MANVVFTFISDLKAFRLEALQSDLLKTQVLTNNLNVAMQSLWNAISLGTMSIAAMAIPFMIASRSAGEFQRSMTLAAAKTEDPRWRAGLDTTIEYANEIRRTWGIAGQEISTAFLELAKSGYELADAMELIEPIAMLTQAEIVGMAEATSIANQMWILFGQEGGVTGYEMMNKIFVASKESRLELNDLPIAIRETGAAFKMANISMDEYLATAAAMSQINVRLGSEMASTIYTLLGDPNRRRQMEEFLGITLMEDGRLAWTEMMRAAAEFRGQEGVGEVLYDIFGMRSMKSFSQLMEGSEIYLELIESITHAGDQMEEAAKQTMGTISGLMTQMRQAVETAIQTPEVIAAMTAAFETLNRAVTEPAMADAIAQYITLTSKFMEESGPGMVYSLLRILNVLNDLSPLLILTSNVFLRVAEAATKIDSSIYMLIFTLMVYKKILPAGITLTGVFSTKMGMAAFRAHGMRAAMLGIVGGLSMVVWATTDAMEKIGAFITIVSFATAAVWLLNAALAAKKTLTLGMYAGAATIGAALGGAAVVAARSADFMKPPDYYYGAPALGGTEHSEDNRQITMNIFNYDNDMDAEDLADALEVL